MNQTAQTPVILKKNKDFTLDENGVATVSSPFYQGKTVMFPEGITGVKIPWFNAGEVDQGYHVPFMCSKIILPDSAVSFSGHDIAGEIDTNNVEDFVLYYWAHLSYVSDYNASLVIPDRNVIPAQITLNKNIKRIELFIENAAENRETIETCLGFAETPINHVSISCGVTSHIKLRLDLLNISNDYDLAIHHMLGSSYENYKIYAYENSPGHQYVIDNEWPEDDYRIVSPNPFIEETETNQETI